MSIADDPDLAKRLHYPGEGDRREDVPKDECDDPKKCAVEALKEAETEEQERRAIASLLKTYRRISSTHEMQDIHEQEHNHHDERDEHIPAIIRSVVIAAILGLAAWVLSQEARMGDHRAEVAGIKARQEIVLQRLDAIEASQHPSTSRRYTADDAARDRESNIREHQQLETRVLRLEQRK